MFTLFYELSCMLYFVVDVIFGNLNRELNLFDINLSLVFLLLFEFFSLLDT